MNFLRDSSFDRAWRIVEARGYGLRPGPVDTVWIVSLPGIAEEAMDPLSLTKAHFLFLAENLRGNEDAPQTKPIVATAS